MNRVFRHSLLAAFLLLMTQIAWSQQHGVASYYHDGLTGLPMANGEPYDPEDLTCAHKEYPLGSVLKVARKSNPDHSVMVIVTDRGPFIKGRVVDLSKRAARELGIIREGISDVVVALVKLPGESSPVALD